jgi:hypothetical protein
VTRISAAGQRDSGFIHHRDKNERHDKFAECASPLN